MSARVDELSDAIGRYMTALEKSPSKEERLEKWKAVRRDMEEWRDISDRLAGWASDDNRSR